MGTKVSKFVYWTPRILASIFVVFLSLMSLDVFEMQLGFWQTLGALFMHNIPALILLAVLVISWKREIVGGIVFILAGVLYMVIIARRADNWWMYFLWSIQIAGVAFVVGGFFLANWIKKRK